MWTCFRTVPGELRALEYMPQPLTRIEKLSRFLRSCWPEQSAHVALLAGAMLLLTVFRIGSWRFWALALLQDHGAGPFGIFNSLTALARALVYAGGAAALYVCFFPKTNSLAWLRRFVYLPVVAGWFANIGVWLLFRQKYPYEIEASLASGIVDTSHPDNFLSSAGLGLWVSIVGLFLIWLASRSLRSGQSMMPLRFSGARGADCDFRSRRFVWLIVVWCMPATALASIIGVTIANPVFFHRGVAPGFLVELYSQLLAAIPFIALFSYAASPEASATFRKSLRLPPIAATLLGLVFPFLLAGVPLLVRLAIARLHWARSLYDDISPPKLLDGLSGFEWPLLLAIISALAEEIAWRGYLQPRMISRYGLYRGIFFVGIVWGAFHFPSDFSAKTHLLFFMTHFLGRLCNCVAWGFVLSWLTLRSKGSVIPAGLAHGVMNALLFMSWATVWPSFATYALWAVLAVALYWFWPPCVTSDVPKNFETDDELSGCGGVAQSPT
jgi:membrane protease YdiL (CAAX protease family)